MNRPTEPENTREEGVDEPRPYVRKTERLHLGRVSAVGAVYFVTFVTKGRSPWLGQPTARQAVLDVLGKWHTEGDGAVWAAVVMPDHIHVLFEAGVRLSVGRCVSRWKTQARAAAGYAGEWQRDFWEHRVRDGESIEEYGWYLILNPYRAGLCQPDVTWPGWWCPDKTRFEFSQSLSAEGVPPREWLDWDEERFAHLKT